MDKLVKINFSVLKDLTVKAVKNLSWVFIFIFFVILILDVMRVKNSVQVVLNIRKDPTSIMNEKGVRINFEDYGKAVNRIQEGKGYQPKIDIITSPFAPK